MRHPTGLHRRAAVSALAQEGAQQGLVAVREIPRRLPGRDQIDTIYHQVSRYSLYLLVAAVVGIVAPIVVRRRRRRR